MKILATSLPAASHFGRVLEVLETLAAIGHQVTYVGSSAFAGRLSVAGIDHVPAGAASFPATSIHDDQRWRAETEAFLVAQTSALMSTITATVQADRPDLIVRDFSEKAAGIVAELHAVPQVTVACTAFSSIEKFCRPDSWLNLLRQDAGLRPTRTTSSESPGTSVAFGPREFYDGDAGLRRRLVFARHQNRHPSQNYVVEEVRARLDRTRPTVVVSMGTIVPSLSETELEYAAAELAGMRINTVVLRPGRAESSVAIDRGSIVVHDGPQQQILALADILVTHAGINSVMEALSHGCPVVNLPVFFDQFFLAERCHRLGLGPIIKPADAVPGALATAVEQVLGDRRYRQAASNLADANQRTATLQELLRTDAICELVSA